MAPATQQAPTKLKPISFRPTAEESEGIDYLAQLHRIGRSEVLRRLIHHELVLPTA